MTGEVSGFRRAALILCALGTAWLVAAAVASPAAASLQCRASVAYVDAPGLARVEPVVANSAPGRGCATDASGLEDVVIAGGTGASAGKLIIRGATARTGFQTARPPTVGAEAGAARIELLDASNRPILGVDLLRSAQTSSCVAGAFGVGGQSDIANLTVLGRRIGADGVLKLVGNVVSGLPIGQVLTVRFDEVERIGSAATADEVVVRRAVHVVLRNVFTGRVLLEAAIGETKIGRSGDGCAPSSGLAPGWLCRSSVARLAVPGLAKLEPVVANSAGGYCAADASGLNGLTLGSPSVGSLTIDAVSADTNAGLPSFPLAGRTASAGARVASLRLASPGNAVVLTADVVSADATARCVGGNVQFTGDSDVVNVRINGIPVTPDGVLEIVGTGVNGTPVGQLIRVSFNEHHSWTDPATDRTAHVWRAIHVRLLPTAKGSALFDAVVGETQLGSILIDCP